MKRIITYLLTLSLLACAFLVPTFASTSVATQNKEQQFYADVLHTANLFKGTEKGYELEREATRAEALVMFLRILGVEDEALKANLNTSFTDVPSWVEPYVSYAEKHNLTTGIGNNKFGTQNIVSAKDYATFTLRGLGYNDRAGDFTWDNSVNKLTELGIIDSNKCKEFQKDFIRGDMAEISYFALATNKKDSSNTLIEELEIGSACTVSVTPVKHSYKASNPVENCVKYDFYIDDKYSKCDNYMIDFVESEHYFNWTFYSLFWWKQNADLPKSIEQVESLYYSGTPVDQLEDYPVTTLLCLKDDEPSAICSFIRSTEDLKSTKEYKALILDFDSLNIPNVLEAADISKALSYDTSKNLLSLENLLPDATKMAVVTNVERDESRFNEAYDRKYGEAIKAVQSLLYNYPNSNYTVYQGEIKNSLYIPDINRNFTNCLNERPELLVVYTDDNCNLLGIGEIGL